jgi:predicted dehydrogenase
MKHVKLALIGCGPHARRIYLPAIQALRSSYSIELSLVIELAPLAESVAAAIRVSGFAPETMFVDRFSGSLPEQLAGELSRRVRWHGIGGVIIATEPLVHKAYAQWALSQGLNILVDKPITARADATSSLESASGILEDYEQLLLAYRRLQQDTETIFMVNAQRRVHPGFQLAERLLGEVGRLTNCPVTSIQSYHCDGQWRLPGEIVTQTYHPYCQGYGKASHSGYHIFDMMYRLYVASGVADKRADAMEILSSFVQPNGFIKQITEADYHALFPGEYERVRPWSDGELRGMFENFGEVDLSGIVTLKHQADAIANLSVNLLHNGFSRRTWTTPGTDLYKGNGRVKHEHHNIQQGPFQNIQIHSYQANDRHEDTGDAQDGLGGNNHFDIHVYRHPMVAGGGPALRVYTGADALAEMEQARATQLTSEFAKYRIVEQFVSYLAGAAPKASLASPIEDHIVPVQIMSGIYRSHVLRSRSANCLVRMKFGAGSELEAEDSASSAQNMFGVCDE